MKFLTSKVTTDEREKQKRKAALSPMVIGILGAIIIAAIIAGIAVAVAAALDDDDSNATTVAAGTLRDLPEDERSAT
ncbi:hypothetical protein SNEBB_007549, partial [Seison nebaliae]